MESKEESQKQQLLKQIMEAGDREKEKKEMLAAKKLLMKKHHRTGVLAYCQCECLRIDNTKDDIFGDEKTDARFLQIRVDELKVDRYVLLQALGHIEAKSNAKAIKAFAGECRTLVNGHM